MGKQLTYANENTIARLVEACNAQFSKENKKKFREIAEKINANFTFDQKTNINFLYEHCHNELIKKTDTNQGKTYINLWNSYKRERNFYTNELLKPYIERVYKDEIDFLRKNTFTPFFFVLGTLNQYTSEACDLSPRIEAIDFNLFMNIDDFQEYFEKLIGKQSADIDEIKATEKIIKIFNQLLKDVPNKANIFSHMDSYYANGENFRQLHNQRMNNPQVIKEIKI